MSYKHLLFGLFLFIGAVSTAQDQGEFTQLFDKDGEKVEFDALIDDIQDAQIILFGELHGVAATHNMEQKLAQKLFETRGDRLILGGEMWEFDQQIIVNEYVSGLITDKQFINDGRLWPNFSRDYQAFIDVARNNNLPFVATNIPRRYASVVYYEGPDKLLEFEKATQKLLPKLPFTFDEDLPIYAEIADQVGGHGTKYLAAAQAIKDATMAMYILNNTKKKNTFLHIHGEYHSKEFQGIYNYIAQEKSKWKVVSISCVMQKDIEKLEDDNLSRANYIFAVKEQPEKADNDSVEEHNPHK